MPSTCGRGMALVSWAHTDWAHTKGAVGGCIYRAWLTASDRVGGVGVFHVKQSVNLAGGCGVGVIVWVNLGWGR